MIRAALRLRPNGFTSQLTPSKFASAAAPLANNIFVRNLCWARDDSPHLDPETPSPERVLEAQHRGPEHYGRYKSEVMRKNGPTPCAIIGDRLPYVSISVATADLMPLARRTHFQRELLTLKVEGGISDFEGETCYMLPLDIRYEDLSSFKVEHVTFRRWPRDPERNPVKMPIPLIFVNSETLPAVKAGGYVHEMFLTGQGLKCTVRQREHIPRFIEADMRRADDGDLRFEHIDMPPGVAPVRCVRVPHTSRPRTPHTHGPTSPPVHAERRYRGKRTEGNFLVGRVVRISGH